MGKRVYTHIEQFEPLILSMREAGLTRQEIADELGLTKEQINNWITRYNHRQSELCVGIVPRRKGRPRQRPLSSAEEYKREISRLQMENKLRTPPRNDSWTAEVRHPNRLKQTPFPLARQLKKLAWRPA